MTSIPHSVMGTEYRHRVVSIPARPCALPEARACSVPSVPMTGIFRRRASVYTPREVIPVLVGREDRPEVRGVEAGQGDESEDFPCREPCIDEEGT